VNAAFYEIAHTTTSERSLSRLPEKIATACLEFIAGPLAENPYRVGKALFSPMEGWHAARRGAYRVIYEIDDERRRVIIHFVEHRAHAYRSR
jgi:mRNA interferase RelE/StbE